MQPKFKIIVLGTRGIPDIQGGVETHCQELYPRIAAMGGQVTVITRSPYVKEKSISSYKGIKLKHIYAPKKKSIEAILHTFIGIIYARFKNPDILHIHTIGPSILTPLARFLGLKVVVTNHGPDYERQKWGKFAKLILKLGEKSGTLYSNKIIAISEVIRKILEQKYTRPDSILIYNGVNIPIKSKNTDYIESLGIKSGNYIIGVGRFVEEKGFHDLIDAYKNIATNVKLVLVGDADHETDYSKRLKFNAQQNGVVLTGFIKGEKLNQIYSNARLFVMPSYHEGLPIALLEAMSYELDIIASDIPANLEVKLNSSDYFLTGNIKDLHRKLSERILNPKTGNYIDIIKDKYNWDKIAVDTFKVYSSLLYQ